jgi:hypothetical protein
MDRAKIDESFDFKKVERVLAGYRNFTNAPDASDTKKWPAPDVALSD